MLNAQRARWSRARAAMRELMKDPERTEMVFEITSVLAGNQPRRLLDRIRRSPGGRRLLRDRPLFEPATCDLAALSRLPEGSFGQVFADWMIEHDLRPGLIEREPSAPTEDLVYLEKRLTQVHDFWHILSGYNRDPIGELGVLAFTLAQTHSTGIAFLLATIVWQDLQEQWRARRRFWSPLIPYLWHAFRSGQRARFLPPLVLEEFFPVPLEWVRASLSVEPLARPFDPAVLPPIAVTREALTSEPKWPANLRVGC